MDPVLGKGSGINQLSLAGRKICGESFDEKAELGSFDENLLVIIFCSGNFRAWFKAESGGKMSANW